MQKIMAHSLTPTAAPATKIPISIASKQTLLSFNRVLACHGSSDQAQELNLCFHRRNVALGLVGVVMGLNVDERKATAAGRRQPPPAPQEKKDPNVSGLMAKVLASKKRKEAMKESMAKQREKGKPIQEEPTP